MSEKFEIVIAGENALSDHVELDISGHNVATQAIAGDNKDIRARDIPQREAFQVVSSVALRQLDYN